MAAKDLGTAQVQQIRDRFAFAREAWKKQFDYMEDDIRMLSPDCQWPEDVKLARSGRPTYASDRLNAQVRQLVNAQRDGRPAVLVHACNSEADKDVANIYQGIIRHIEYESSGDLAYDEGSEWQIRAGLGFWRITTDYEDPLSMDQRLMLESINNPLNVLIDPTFKQIDGSDIGYAFVCEVLTEDEFKETYPDSEIANSSSSIWRSYARTLPDWFEGKGKSVLVVEYWCKEYKTETLYQLKDRSGVKGSDMPKDKSLWADMLLTDVDGKPISRETQIPTIKCYKLNGIEILEEKEWLGNYIPIIPIFGECLLDTQTNLRLWSGIVRNGKESQMMLNVAKTSMVELIAKMPKAQFMGPRGFMGNRKNDWAQMNVSSPVGIEYEIVDDQGHELTEPKQLLAEPPIQGVMAFIQTVENDLKAESQMYDPSLGNKMSEEQSGIAIKHLQSAAAISNFHFSDNEKRAIRLTARMFVELIPKYYRQEKVMRIIGVDDKPSLVTINGTEESSAKNITKDGIAKIYNVTVGKFDVAVSSGPSYETKRQESLATLIDLADKDPVILQFCRDLIVGQIDSSISTELQERLQKSLPPNIQPPDQTQGPNDPKALQAQLAQYKDMVQKLTEALQQETVLADKVQQELQLKLKIAEMDRETQLLKQQSSLQHDSNVELLRTETAAIRASTSQQFEEMKHQSNQAHDLLKQLHGHILNMDAAKQTAAIQKSLERTAEDKEGIKTYRNDMEGKN